jgi:hypothetical protein
VSIGFRVYIDESGDEGFKFDQPGKGSSRWFVLSAVVTREENDRDAAVGATVVVPPLDGVFVIYDMP